LAAAEIAGFLIPAPFYCVDNRRSPVGMGQMLIALFADELSGVRAGFEVLRG